MCVSRFTIRGWKSSSWLWPPAREGGRELLAAAVDFPVQEALDLFLLRFMEQRGRRLGCFKDFESDTQEWPRLNLLRGGSGKATRVECSDNMPICWQMWFFDWPKSIQGPCCGLLKKSKPAKVPTHLPTTGSSMFLISRRRFCSPSCFWNFKAFMSMTLTSHLPAMRSGRIRMNQMGVISRFLDFFLGTFWWTSRFQDGVCPPAMFGRNSDAYSHLRGLGQQTQLLHVIARPSNMINEEESPACPRLSFCENKTARNCILLYMHGRAEDKAPGLHTSCLYPIACTRRLSLGLPMKSMRINMLTSSPNRRDTRNLSFKHDGVAKA